MRRRTRKKIVKVKKVKRKKKIKFNDVLNRFINFPYSVVLFFMIILLPNILWMFIMFASLFNNDIIKTVDFDLGEKRRKATFSNAININNITSEVEKVYNDRIPFRSVIIKTNNVANEIIERPYPTIEELAIKVISGVSFARPKKHLTTSDGSVAKFMDEAVMKYNGHGLFSKDIEPYVDSANYPLKVLNGKVIAGQSNWLFLYDLNMLYYQGKNTLSDTQIGEYIKPYETINTLAKKKNKEFAILVCPEKEEIYSEYMPGMEIVNEEEKPLAIRNYVASYSELNYLYPKEVLLNNKDKYKMYMRDDTHWTFAGSYFAYRELMKKFNIDTVPISNIKIIRVPETSFDLINLASLDINRAESTFQYQLVYKPDIEVKFEYRDEKFNLLQTRSSNKNGKKIVLIGDSFRTFFMDFLSKDFECATIATYDTMAEQRVALAVREADYIVFECVERNETLILPNMCQRVYQVLSE